MFAPAQIIQQGQNYHVQHGTDQGLFVQFYLESLKDEEETTLQGRPIFRDVEFIKIIPVGDKNTIVCRPVKTTDDAGTPPDSVRWPQQYAAFKAQQEQPLVGTPITEWPPISKSQALMLKGVNVHTVEALAAVSDSNLVNLGMGARELRDKAIAYLKSAEGSSGVSALAAEVNEWKTKFEALQNQMNALLKTETKKKAKEVIDGENAS